MNQKTLDKREKKEEKAASVTKPRDTFHRPDGICVAILSPHGSARHSGDLGY